MTVIYRVYLKRFFDIVISLLLVIPVLLVCFIIGVCIKLEDGGPIFYCQKRLGIKKIPYKMYKLRSMKMNAPDLRNEDGSTFNSDNDPRLLNIGFFIRKTSLDELPQIFNVIRGDMSLIGPRPDLEEQGILYDSMHKDQTKFKVKPGITGYAQCNGRNDLNWDEKLKFDKYYVENCSFKLDSIIILQTIASVLLRKGVNKSDENSKG